MCCGESSRLKMPVGTGVGLIQCHVMLDRGGVGNLLEYGNFTPKLHLGVIGPLLYVYALSA